MSIRSTIADGPYWHLYHDVTDGSVWLKMELAETQDGTQPVCVKLPPAILAALQGVEEQPQ